MSAYLTLDQIKGGLPSEITAQLLDDQSVGAPDPTAWPAILASVTAEIDGKLSQRYTLPLADPVPQIILNAAFVLAAELCYQRKQFYGDANPWNTRAMGIRGTLGLPGGQAGLLDRIASGDQPLTVETPKARTPAVAITAPAKTFSGSGSNLC